MSQNDNDLTHRDLHEDLVKNKIDIEVIKNDIHTIKTNHLFHIEQSVANLEKELEKLDGRIWVIVAGTATILATLVAERLF